MSNSCAGGVFLELTKTAVVCSRNVTFYGDHSIASINLRMINKTSAIHFRIKPQLKNVTILLLCNNPINSF